MQLLSRHSLRTRNPTTGTRLRNNKLLPTTLTLLIAIASAAHVGSSRVRRIIHARPEKVKLDPANHRLREVQQQQNLPQVFPQQDEARAAQRYIRAAADCDAHVRRDERGGVVDPVADHRDARADVDVAAVAGPVEEGGERGPAARRGRFLKVGYLLGLFVWEDAGDDVGSGYPDGAGDGGGGDGVVARDHVDVDAELLELRDDEGGFGADLVRDGKVGEDGGGLCELGVDGGVRRPVGGEHDDGLGLGLPAVEARADVVGDDDALLLHEGLVADVRLDLDAAARGEHAGDAAAGDLLDAGALDGRAVRVSAGVLKPLRETEDQARPVALLIVVVDNDSIDDFRLATHRECARLVKDDCVQPAGLLEGLAAAFRENAVPRRQPGADEQRRRCSQSDPAGAGDDKHRDGKAHAPQRPAALIAFNPVRRQRTTIPQAQPDEPRDDRKVRDDGHEITGDKIRDTLDGRTLHLSLAHDAHNVVEHGAAGDALDLDGDGAALVDGAREDIVADGLVHETRLARERGLVELAVAGDDAAVERRGQAVRHEDVVADLQQLDGDRLQKHGEEDDGVKVCGVSDLALGHVVAHVVNTRLSRADGEQRDGGKAIVVPRDISKFMLPNLRNFFQTGLGFLRLQSPRSSEMARTWKRSAAKKYTGVDIISSDHSATEGHEDDADDEGRDGADDAEEEADGETADLGLVDEGAAVFERLGGFHGDLEGRVEGLEGADEHADGDVRLRGVFDRDLGLAGGGQGLEDGDLGAGELVDGLHDAGRAVLAVETLDVEGEGAFAGVELLVLVEGVEFDDLDVETGVFDALGDGGDLVPVAGVDDGAAVGEGADLGLLDEGVLVEEVGADGVDAGGARHASDGECGEPRAVVRLVHDNGFEVGKGAVPLRARAGGGRRDGGTVAVRGSLGGGRGAAGGDELFGAAEAADLVVALSVGVSALDASEDAGTESLKEVEGASGGGSVGAFVVAVAGAAGLDVEAGEVEGVDDGLGREGGRVEDLDAVREDGGGVGDGGGREGGEGAGDEGGAGGAVDVGDKDGRLEEVVRRSSGWRVRAERLFAVHAGDVCMLI
ncbi:LOW QUALITY PROTEIN: hypothetical protein Dda_6541 [Drechslerella dactyloides]|uniref:Uncharacterized protein n=1 Tax=Drechslerella dactyloides TaxID=74499 RepID=A0AAD6IUX7_DREDA|nr:LOW QUALITY PROTEIN: hypothetical protein Dda_6541 [Drechslerella dactyloides]